MKAEHSARRRLSWGIFRSVAIVLTATVASALGYAVWEYTAWRNKMIEWDYGTIHLLCGGDREADRLLDIRFVKQWEYKALKPTSNGNPVWIHWRLSKRDCGNWMLVDRTQHELIRPFDLRWPNGAPYRQTYSCLGIPIDREQRGGFDITVRNR